MMGLDLNQQGEKLPLDLNQQKWDRRFLEMASLVSTWSKDPSTQCGAVVVRPDRTIASVGFNGFPRGCSDSPDLYADRETKYARVVHAEVNALIHTRESLDGDVLYTWPPGLGPTCDRCSTIAIQTGIKRVVHVEDQSDFASRWRESTARAIQMYHEAGIGVYSYSLAWWHNETPR